MVLDGVTRVPDDGCVHDVPWYVATLGNALTDDLSGTTKSLNAILADAIHAVNDAHKDTCDLANPQSPASQVAIVRERHGAMEWLILGDCTVVLEREGEPPVAYCDDRVDHLPNPPEPVLIEGVRRYPLDYIARVRNQPGSDGFWVASTAPEAADEALYGSWPANEIRAIALLSDGLTRLVERYGWTWSGVLDAGAGEGVPALIKSVHAADASGVRPGARGKVSDDATGVIIALR